MWFAASGFQDILLSQFLPQLFIFFLFIHPLFTLVRNRLNFNFSLIMYHDDGIQALTCTSDMLKDNGRRFNFFVLKRINMLWKNSCDSKVDLVRWIVHDDDDVYRTGLLVSLVSQKQSVGTVIMFWIGLFIYRYMASY